MQNNNKGNQNASGQAGPNSNVKANFTCKKPTTGNQSSVPQTSTGKMQNNNKFNQNASGQTAPNTNVKPKPKFTCKDCSFTCSSSLNFKIHMQTVHHVEVDITQNMIPLKTEEKQNEKATVNIQPVKQNEKAAVNTLPETKTMGPSSGTEKPNEKAAVNSQPGILPPTTGRFIAKFKNFKSGVAKEVLIGTMPGISGKHIAKLKDKKSGADKEPLIEKKTVVPSPGPGTERKTVAHSSGTERRKEAYSSGTERRRERHSPGTERRREAYSSGTEKQKEKAAVNIQPERRVVAHSSALGTDKPKEEATANIQPGTMPGSSGRHIATLQDYISRADREPLIGLEYVLEYCYKTKANDLQIRYYCELCECDTEVLPIVEHLAGFRHRKLYLAKEYPYVLKAHSTNKEDQSQFVRRMALEIEREEGTKMYMIDSAIWIETMMTLRNEHKKMKKKTRWDNDKNDDIKMKKALKFLETFEIESEIEATTVARLCEKLAANIEFYNTKTKEDALFPARVARAQDVAMSLMKNAARQRTQLLNQTQINSKYLPPHLKRPTPLPGNADLKNKVGMQSGFPGPSFQNINGQQNMPKAPPFPQAQQHPFAPSKETKTMQGPPMSKMNENPKKAENTKSDDSLLKNISQDDQFFKKLKALLEALPENDSLSDKTQMNSKLLMLKSMLVNEKSAEHEQANQKLMTQIASMVKDTISAQNASLNQQLMMLMTSQSSTAMVMQTASLTNNPLMLNQNSVIGPGLVPGIQSSGNLPINMNSLMPFNQTFGSQAYGQMGEIASGPIDQNAYKVPSVGMQNYPSTSQNYNNFEYGNSAQENYLPQRDPYVSQRDGIINSLPAGQNEQTVTPYTDVGYKPSVYEKEWDDSYYGNSSTQVAEPRYVDHKEEQVPYTRVCLSPSSPRNQYDDYNDNTRGESGIQDARHRPSTRPYNSSDWDDRERDMLYMKRARMDMDNRIDRLESSQIQSLESLGINTADMPEELLKRIQGKDLFTASAIISEYAERRSGK